MDRKELKSKLKEIHKNDWKECLQARDNFVAMANYRVVQEITDKYVGLIKEFESLEDSAKVNDLLMDIEVYKMGLALIHLLGDKSLGARECFDEMSKSLDLLRNLVVPDTYRNGIPLTYTKERIALDTANMEKDAMEVSNVLAQKM